MSPVEISDGRGGGGEGGDGVGVEPNHPTARKPGQSFNTSGVDWKRSEISERVLWINAYSEVKHY